VAEGFESRWTQWPGRNNNVCAFAAVCKAVHIPVIAAGGIATGRQMLATMVLAQKACR
jgi:enoyl-[acyl-carrier protein] reductase II